MTEVFFIDLKKHVYFSSNDYYLGNLKRIVYKAKMRSFTNNFSVALFFSEPDTFWKKFSFWVYLSCIQERFCSLEFFLNSIQPSFASTKKNLPRFHLKKKTSENGFEYHGKIEETKEIAAKNNLSPRKKKKRDREKFAGNGIWSPSPLVVVVSQNKA